MKCFVEGLDRAQSTLFPKSLDDYVAEDNSVRAVDVFVDGFSHSLGQQRMLGSLGCRQIAPAYVRLRRNFARRLHG